MKQHQLKKGSMGLLCAVMLFFMSCVEGYKDDITWASSVKNATLESPAADKITVKFSADGTEQTIEWPLVPGAGGYLVTVYNMDDPDNPVVIGEENQVVDGVSVKRPSTDDTRYKLVIKTLGNGKNNNKEALTATEKSYNNMLPVTAVIPAGTNLTDYFTANPIPASDTELCYELVSGGNYTMTGNVSTGSTRVTIRGDKVDHPVVTMTDGSFVVGAAGFVLKFIDIDYSGFIGTSGNSIILMDANFPASGLTEAGYAMIPTTQPIAIQSCKITGLQYYLFYDNNKKYAIGTFLIKDCIVGANTGTFGNALVRFQAGMVKDWTVTNSTFYNEQAPSNSSNRFCQISSGNVTSVKATTEQWLSGSMSITNCTFWQAGKTAQSFNSNGAMGNSSDKVTVQKCIFVDCYEVGRIISRFRRGNTSAIFTGGENSQWYDGKLFSEANTGSQDITADVNYLTTDPKLTYLGNGQFKMEGAEQISKRTGDPRWLSAQ
ncbi:MAG: DUF4957 domain-containing protein [Dysgonamonadaceae bacterium]|jgi:hypothetical protein|nr:DUF4957 domain-containing protein [Dysgonamonadaceae bacterium]